MDEVNPTPVTPEVTPVVPSPLPKNHTPTIVTIILLLVFWPAGVILMWVWTKWPLWLKLVLTVLPLIILAVLGIMTAGLIAAINPAKQIGLANNAQRKADIGNVMSILEAYTIEHNGSLPPQVLNATQPQEIGSGVGQVDICSEVVPEFSDSLPTDPSLRLPAGVTDCSDVYSTKYTLVYNPTTQSLTVSAPAAEAGEIITVTR